MSAPEAAVATGLSTGRSAAVAFAAQATATSVSALRVLTGFSALTENS
jgi:hypothetical protein